MSFVGIDANSIISLVLSLDAKGYSSQKIVLALNDIVGPRNTPLINDIIQSEVESVLVNTYDRPDLAAMIVNDWIPNGSVELDVLSQAERANYVDPVSGHLIPDAGEKSMLLTTLTRPQYFATIEDVLFITSDKDFVPLNNQLELADGWLKSAGYDLNNLSSVENTLNAHIQDALDRGDVTDFIDRYKTLLDTVEGGADHSQTFGPSICSDRFRLCAALSIRSGWKLGDWWLHTHMGRFPEQHEGLASSGHRRGNWRCRDPLGFL